MNKLLSNTKPLIGVASEQKKQIEIMGQREHFHLRIKSEEIAQIKEPRS